MIRLRFEEVVIVCSHFYRVHLSHGMVAKIVPHWAVAKAYCSTYSDAYSGLLSVSLRLASSVLIFARTTPTALCHHFENLSRKSYEVGFFITDDALLDAIIVRSESLSAHAPTDATGPAARTTNFSGMQCVQAAKGEMQWRGDLQALFAGRSKLRLQSCELCGSFTTVNCSWEDHRNL